MRGFNALLVGAMRARWITIGLTVGIFAAVGLGDALRAAAILPGLRPAELMVDLTLPQNASIHASETAASGSTRCSPGTPMSRAGAPMSGAAPSASTCR